FGHNRQLPTDLASREVAVVNIDVCIAGLDGGQSIGERVDSIGSAGAQIGRGERTNDMAGCSRRTRIAEGQNYRSGRSSRGEKMDMPGRRRSSQTLVRDVIGQAVQSSAVGDLGKARGRGTVGRAFVSARKRRRGNEISACGS